jgi:glycosyl transferase family 25
MNSSIEVPVWIINLKRDTERLQFMQEQMERLGIDYRVIEAIDGRSLGEDEKEPYSKSIALRDFGRELTPGEIGCALTHIRIWNQTIEEDINEVLVLEDDVYIGIGLIEVLKHRDRLPQDYQHINFSTNALQIPFGDFVTDIYRASRHAERPYLTSTYLITKNGAQKLLDLVSPLYMPIDNFITITDIVSYGIYPRVAVLSETPSGIGSRWKNMPKLSFGQKKWRQFKEIIKSIAIFFGATEQGLINIHLKINKILKR